MTKEVVLKKVEFERKWLVNLKAENELMIADIDTAFDSIKYFVENIREQEENND